jgi:flagellar hook-associated protein 1 FlgK
MSVLQTGVTGLLAAQRQLSVVSHNIANVNTQGYSRQRAELATQQPQYHGFGYLGYGVTVNTISRVYDQFAVKQVWTSTAALGQSQQFSALANQVNDLLGTGDSGLPASLQAFFDSVQGVANDPSSRVSRQLMINSAQALAAQFRDVDARLEAVASNTNAMLGSAVDEVNNLTSSIADLNRRIASGANAGHTPNDLFDQRDELIRQLSERVSVTTAVESNGMVNVFIGSGQAVVVGGDAVRLATVPNPTDSSRMEVAYMAGNTPVVISPQLSGGSIGGILEFRSQILEPARDTINLMAYGVAAAFNEVHAQGMDMNGELGGDFFLSLATAGPPPTAEARAHSRNSGNGAVSVTLGDPSAVTASTYVLARQGGSYTLTRQSDGAVLSLPGFPGAPVTVDGMTIALDSGAIADGDTFIISPVANAARNFDVAITDPDLIAAAGPVRSRASLDNGGTGIVGQAVLSDPAAWSGEAYRLIAVDTDADGVTDAWSLRDSADTEVLAGAYVPGETIEFGGLSFVLDGQPLPGDEFIIEPNSGGVSDNRNALALAALQSMPVMNGGRASFQQIYGNLIGEIGGKSLQAEVSVSVQTTLLERAVDTREAISGVNLDEEAADIMRYQLAYQAAAQLIATANSIFQTLIDVVRR